MEQERTIFRDLKIGKVDRDSVYLEASVRERDSGPELSIVAELRHDQSWAGGGQCLDAVRGVLDRGELAPGIRAVDVRRLLDLWERWHLNGMRAGCEHQRAAGWDKRPIDPDQPLDSYGHFAAGASGPTWNMLTWVRRTEHPHGLMCEPCWVCGYKYGTAWLYEALPDDVVPFLEEFGQQ
jgi:hypothetical protein